MSKANLQRVRDAIAKAPARLTDMCRIGQPNCGTPGCIVGWTVGVLDPSNPFNAFRRSRELLGLTEVQEGNLFLGRLSEGQIYNLKITRKEVLTAIDSLIENPRRPMPAWPPRVIDLIERNN